MYFDWRTFIAQKLYALTHGASDGSWLLAAFQGGCYPLAHACFGLDELVFPEISITPIERPLFIVCTPRSGSTLLFDLLAADPANGCFRMRDLIFPSPVLRALIPAFLMAWADRTFERRFGPVQAIHPMRLEQPDEDESLFLLLGNSGISYYLFPYGSELDHLAVNRFWEWPSWKRERFGRFHRRCVQRLLWSRKANRFISKSPHFYGKVDDLLRWYPDARFVHLVRSPYESVPSTLSMVTTFWSLTAARVPTPDELETNYRALVQLTEHGNQALQRLPRDRVTTLPYARLIADPREAVESLYAEEGWPISATYREHLQRAADRQRGRQSDHRYSLDQFGLTRTRVRRDFSFMFDDYDLDEP